MGRRSRKLPLPVTRGTSTVKKADSQAATGHGGKAAAKISRRKKHRSKAIGRFHDLNKLIDKKKVQTNLSPKEAEELEKLKQEFEELGGIEVYQELSKSGEKRTQFNTSRWLVSELKKLDLCPTSSDTKVTLNLLDVGALGLNYKKEASWINSRAIDLNAANGSGVEQVDFFELDVEPSSLDIVALSLVINYVGDPLLRGLMLERASSLVKPGGFVYVVLPLACVNNSRYFTAGLLVEMMTELRCEVVSQDETKRLSFLLFRRKTETQKGELKEEEESRIGKKGKKKKTEQKLFPKRLIRQGPQRNNFHIIL